MQFEEHKLPNGARIVLSQIPGWKSVTTTIMFGVGSRYEAAPINGISHFLEHVMFKGTEKRPTTLDISKELDSVGASYNAFTSKEVTSYYIKLAKRHGELAIDILADMLKNSVFDAEEIIRERGVISEELNMYEDKPEVLAEEQLEREMYGDTPLGWDIGGSLKTVNAVTRAKIVKYFNTHYHPNNMIIGVVGGFNKERTLEQLTEHFGDLKRKTTPDFKPAKLAVKGTAPHAAVRYKKTEQAHLAIGFEGVTYGHKDLQALQLLATVFGGNMSSRLFINIRERQGLCYYISSSVTKYHDSGLFMIQAGLDKGRVDQAVTSIMHELAVLKSEGITADELKKAKEYRKGKLALALENSESISSFVLNQAYFESDIETPEEKYAAIDSVTLDDVQRVIDKYLTEDTLTLALVGPYKAATRFKKLLKIKQMES